MDVFGTVRELLERIFFHISYLAENYKLGSMSATHAIIQVVLDLIICSQVPPHKINWIVLKRTGKIQHWDQTPQMLN